MVVTGIEPGTFKYESIRLTVGPIMMILFKFKIECRKMQVWERNRNSKDSVFHPSSPLIAKSRLSQSGNVYSVTDVGSE